MAFETPDREILATWPEDAIHTPAGGLPTSVVVARQDTSTLPDINQNNVLLFGTMDESGFEFRPLKGDCIEYQSTKFKIFDMKEDNAGGTPGTAGLHIHLVRV